MSKNIMALDQGITSSRTILYNEKGEPIAMAKDSGIKIKNDMVELTDKKNFYFWFRLALFGLFWFQWLQFSYSQTGGHRQANLRVIGTFLLFHNI